VVPNNAFLRHADSAIPRIQSLAFEAAYTGIGQSQRSGNNGGGQTDIDLQ
jgi:hypothetical protein